jgi:hypothetical protein
MSARPLAHFCLPLLAAITLAGAATPAPSPASKPASASFLPDSFVLARVQDRSIRVDRFVDAYFASYAPVRPKPDSAGRVEFLGSMINKDVLGITALKINKPLTFEDRSEMREYTDRVLSNALYRQAVLESVTVSEEEIQRVHAQYGFEQHYRRIRFDDPNAAALVRRQVMAHTIPWTEAVRRSADFDPTHPDADLGWIKREVFDLRTAELVWDLAPGAVSEAVRDPDGFYLLQLVERRPVALPALEPMRPTLTAAIRDLHGAKRADRLQAEIGRRIGVVYDTTNIRWSAAKFRGFQTVKHEGQNMVLEMGGIGDDLDPADTSRVLVRWRDGRFSLGTFVIEYNHQSPLMRQPVGDFESFRGQLDAMVLEPYMADEARSRGLDKDPGVASVVEMKHEELLVDHLFADSVQSRIRVTSAERRKYYDQHISLFTTYPTVHFAAIVRGSQAGADSVMARLKKGETAASILHADSLAGLTSGSIRDLRDEGRGGPYNKILFGELRPGQSTVVGPDKQGDWLVLQLLSFDPGHPVPYAQAESMVDESLQNIKGEEELKRLIARHSKKYRISSHPELVMRINLVDPAAR